MEISTIRSKVGLFLKKYRYAVCVLLIGVVLMLIPTEQKPDKDKQEPIVDNAPTVSVEDQLCVLLSKIQGAGKVEIMLSYASGSETLYHTDVETEADGTKNTTVLITGADREESPLVTRVDPPKYLGAIILCQGADSAAVRLAITEAISKYTGLGADQIAVLKMK